MFKLNSELPNNQGKRNKQILLIPLEESLELQEQSHPSLAGNSKKEIALTYHHLSLSMESLTFLLMDAL